MKKDNINIIKIDNPSIKTMFDKFPTKQHQKDDIVFNTNEKCDHLSFIVSGKLKVVKYNIDGKEQVLSLVGKNEMFGGPLVFANENYPAYVIATEDTSIKNVTKDEVLGLLQNKEFLTIFLEEFSKRIINLSNVIDYLSDNSIESRLKKYLSKLMEKQNSTKIVLEKPKSVIAKEIGSVREVVSRAFKKLHNKEIIKIIDEENIEIIEKDYFE